MLFIDRTIHIAKYSACVNVYNSIRTFQHLPAILRSPIHLIPSRWCSLLQVDRNLTPQSPFDSEK